MPETRECVVQGSTNVFTSIHSMDMKYLHIDRNGEFHLGYSKNSIQGISWYDLVHWENLREAQSKHRLITQSEQERSCILLLRLESSSHNWIWVHIVLQVKDSNDTSQQPVIVCTNQVLSSEKEALVMRANSWLYQFYSLHSKMHYSLAYETHTSRLPTYYPPAAAAPAVVGHSYHATSATTGPESAPVPLHAVQPLSPYAHIHPAITPINGTAGHHHPHHPTPVLQYSPQAGSLPYPTFVPVNASPVAESESNRQTSLHPPSKRTHTPPQQQQQQQQQPEESESPEPNTKRPNHGHHLPPPPTSTYHHPRASTFAYPTSMFGTGGFSSTVTELGTVVPVSSYYGGHQMLTSVPYHHQIGHHFRSQNKLSLFDNDVESNELEQSLTPTNTEEVSNMISMTPSSPSSFFKYPPSNMTLSNQYYTVAGQYFEVDKYASKSPQSITSDYGSGTSSPPSAFEKPKKDTNEFSEALIISGNNGNIQQQMYHTALRTWNNYPIYTDLSASKPIGLRRGDAAGDTYDCGSQRIAGNNYSRVIYQNNESTFNDGSATTGNLVSNQANAMTGMPLAVVMSETLSSPPSLAQLSVGGTSIQASSRSPPSPSEHRDLNPSSCGVGRALGYGDASRRGASKRSRERSEEAKMSSLSEHE
ncbi:neuronal PAS domain-containing protein 4-like protein [Dinothrombium tinctorium]|uniref:Neuronal PAS domain-containing protein 4-like protein n=1 Tax=Dinothrombium tinctorium TaxID=1965070 RepID=A0A3S3QU39_9ACAR|nr:neuronal PAS domain-containing protein 4-like protein [Dinothrombium tinctorium]